MICTSGQMNHLWIPTPTIPQSTDYAGTQKTGSNNKCTSYICIVVAFKRLQVLRWNWRLPEKTETKYYTWSFIYCAKWLNNNTNACERPGLVVNERIKVRDYNHVFSLTLSPCLFSWYFYCLHFEADMLVIVKATHKNYFLGHSALY